MSGIERVASAKRACIVCNGELFTTVLSLEISVGGVGADRYNVVQSTICGYERTECLKRIPDIRLLYGPRYPPHQAQSVSDTIPGRSELSRLAAKCSGSLLYQTWVDPRFGSLPGPVRPGATALDIGCGVGLTLDRLKAQGWLTSGVEPVRSAAEIARQKGHRIYVDETETAGLPESSFDLIIMQHSIEHLPDPRRVLTECFRLLKPSGLMSVSCPNFDAIGRRVMRGAWTPLDVPRHISHFTPASLVRILSDSGFKPASIQFDNGSHTVTTSIGGLMRMKRLWRSEPIGASDAGSARANEGLDVPGVLNSVIDCLILPFLRLFRIQLKSAMVVLSTK